MVRCGRLRWFGYLECKSGNDWVSACRNMEVVEKSRGGARRLGWCLNEDMEELGLQPEWAVLNLGYVEKLHIGVNVYRTL